MSDFYIIKNNTFIVLGSDVQILVKKNYVDMQRKEILDMTMLLRWVAYSLAIMLIAWLIPGISVSSFWAALLVVIIMGLINIFVRPILTFITLPINFLTLGLFTFVLNALLFMLAGYVAPGFSVSGFWSALLGSLLLSLLSLPINRIGDNGEV